MSKTERMLQRAPRQMRTLDQSLQQCLLPPDITPVRFPPRTNLLRTLRHHKKAEKRAGFLLSTVGPLRRISGRLLV